MELFPGVREMLEELKASGRRLAVATGKSRRGLDHQFALTGLGELFAASRCADETRPKPDPAMLLELMDELAVQRHELLMIGDTSHDLGMAQSAGVDAVAVGYGAHAIESLGAWNPRASVRSVAELRLWLTRNA
jgi:phosphoglycolate phosphatase